MLNYSGKTTGKCLRPMEFQSLSKENLEGAELTLLMGRSLSSAIQGESESTVKILLTHLESTRALLASL